jgi:hypothetical protein
MFLGLLSGAPEICSAKTDALSRVAENLNDFRNSPVFCKIFEYPRFCFHFSVDFAKGAHGTPSPCSVLKLLITRECIALAILLFGRSRSAADNDAASFCRLFMARGSTDIFMTGRVTVDPFRLEHPAATPN